VRKMSASVLNKTTYEIAMGAVGRGPAVSGNANVRRPVTSGEAGEPGRSSLSVGNCIRSGNLADNST